MFNDRLSREEAKERIQERMREAEIYSRQKQLGYGDSGTAKWVFVLIILVVGLAVGLLL